MNFYKELELIIEAKNPQEKIKKFDEFFIKFQNKELSFEVLEAPKKFLEPSYIDLCEIISPQDVPKRKNLTEKSGQINLIHAIAHIEYSAIDLALDAAYRFHDLPQKYYEDWLDVAADEIRHFVMLETLLQELDSFYGDVEVHNALFEALQRTQTLVERMAVVPRYLEANGLDATPMILEKLRKLPQKGIIAKIVEALKIILDEEVDHVKKGDNWFRYACTDENKNPQEEYFRVIEKFYPQGFLRPRNINIDARKEAGFSCSELEFIAKRELC
ncbi:MAG: ferritin-like domain-containing protein [Campylobacterales bacterium]|nr:ferritin-like domain-containing protein [Campylobacterales bacterium]